MPHILYVEDFAPVLLIVTETLEAEGWQVEPCVDGARASRLVRSEAHFDLFLFDTELPILSGLELTRLARRLPHRNRTPVILLSASEYELEARRAGADVFLKKPEGMKTLVENIKQLFNRQT
ncbi:MAG TPA: response regulator [Pyrinomonadaceae bacterium]|nr:response regulator [Pyrinomonadaceae bacterium]